MTALSPLRLALALLLAVPAHALAQPVAFNRDVRPILSDACFSCHGPDKAKRKAKLHFDTEDGAKAAIVAGKPDESEIIRRITSADPEKRMPPPAASAALKPEQVATMKRWIADGAPWQKHWSFIPPVGPPLPKVKDANWVRNPVDQFVLARLEKEGLKPSPEADRVTLIRRLSLDLTGLPPTPEEVDDFLREASAKPQAAYEAVVDRLLKSPRYGERMAARWLDAARYADTNGYQTDGDRIMWRWRDWVIDAFNSNMRFDRFTVEQIAGDMLPGATLEQKIATGFNRNHRANSEGGIIPEEYAVEYVVDRVDTTATVWLGLSAGCAKCHSHKYDPITQQEFYQLFAYFNNVPEKGKAIKYGNSPPYIKTPTPEQQVKARLLQAHLRATEERVRELEPKLDRAQRQWEQALDTTRPIDWSLTRGLVAHYPLDSLSVQTATGAAATSPRALHGQPTLGPGRVGKAVYLDGKSHVEAGDVAAFGFFDKFAMGAWVKPAGEKGGTILSRMVDTDRADGYSLTLQGGKVHVHLVKRWLDDAIRVETEAALTPGQWHHVFFTYDGSRVAAGVKVYVDGRPAKLKVNLDDLNQSFNTTEPLRIGAGGGAAARFHGAIDDVRVYDHVLPPEDVAMLAEVAPVNVLVEIPAGRRSAAQRHKVRSYYLETAAPAEIREAHAKRQAARREWAQFDESIPTTMVMQEMPTPRDTHILLRGEYDKKGAKVQPGIPAALPPLPAGVPNNRLGFAYWLVSKDNPLTARVAVNRSWQMLFGTGIVKTVEDFGAQGDWPSHPELLDWLAVEFRESGWDGKQLLRTIVTSATYRQNSRATPELRAKDPDNRLLARGPRVRLPGEMIRDQALFASGLLVEKVGGPSVRPYQPAGLVKELHGTDEDLQDHGPNLYRRSLYTFWKRTVAPPVLMIFDAANRETCVVRESRTNTPLQALNLMNDVTYVEAARVLAERVMREKQTPADRLTRAFRLVTARPPRPVELKLLREALAEHREHYRANPAAARKLVSAGEAPRDEAFDVTEVAAYTAVANLLLNLDETITKE